MYRVCLEKSTGKLIEMQSGGRSTDKKLEERRLKTLQENAINAGYKAEHVEIKWISDQEWRAIQAALIKPTPEQIAESERELLIQAKIREQAIAALKAEGRFDADEMPVTK